MHLKLNLNIYDIVGSDGRPGSQGARGQPGSPGNNGNPGEKGKNHIEYNMYNRYYPVRLVTMATLWIQQDWIYDVYIRLIFDNAVSISCLPQGEHFFLWMFAQLYARAGILPRCAKHLHAHIVLLRWEV